MTHKSIALKRAATIAANSHPRSGSNDFESHLITNLLNSCPLKLFEFFFGDFTNPIDRICAFYRSRYQALEEQETELRCVAPVFY